MPLLIEFRSTRVRAGYQRERRQLAHQRKAALAQTPTGPNQVWQLVTVHLSAGMPPTVCRQQRKNPSQGHILPC